MTEKVKEVEQVFYDGRWIEREHFRVFVYQDNEKRLADTYDEYLNLIAQGWSTHPPGHPEYMKKDFLDTLNDDLHDIANESLYLEITDEPVIEPARRGRKKKQIDILS